MSIPTNGPGKADPLVGFFLSGTIYYGLCKIFPLERLDEKDEHDYFGTFGYVSQISLSISLGIHVADKLVSHISRAMIQSLWLSSMRWRRFSQRRI